MTFDQLLAALRAAAPGQESTLYLVGGCVRDGLVGRPLVDVDIAVEGDALACARAVAAHTSATYVPLREQHHTGRVVFAQGPILHADFTEAVGGIHADLARRDFTIDALAVALSGFSGDWNAATILDHHNGRLDLEAGLVRMVSPQALEEDPIRLLRGVRIGAELGYTIEPATYAAIQERAPLVAQCAGERVREELCRILALSGAALWVEQLDALGLLAAIFPELTVGKGVSQPKEHYWDVFRHEVETLAAIEVLLQPDLISRLGDRAYLQAAVAHRPHHDELDAYLQEPVGNLPRPTILKLAALFHDVAKPQTKALQPDGRTRFLGHAEQGADTMRATLGRLHFSSKEIAAVAGMVHYHLRPGQWSDTTPSPKALYRYFRDVAPVAVDTILLNLADHLAARGPQLHLGRWQQHVAVAQDALTYYFERQEQKAAPRLITGYELMDWFQLTPGPMIGALLTQIDEAHALGQLSTKEDVLDYTEQILEDMAFEEAAQEPTVEGAAVNLNHEKSRFPRRGGRFEP